jgi:hypothetical protein
MTAGLEAADERSVPPSPSWLLALLRVESSAPMKSADVVGLWILRIWMIDGAFTAGGTTPVPAGPPLACPGFAQTISPEGRIVPSAASTAARKRSARPVAISASLSKSPRSFSRSTRSETSCRPTSPSTSRRTRSTQRLSSCGYLSRSLTYFHRTPFTSSLLSSGSHQSLKALMRRDGIWFSDMAATSALCQASSAAASMLARWEQRRAANSLGVSPRPRPPDTYRFTKWNYQSQRTQLGTSVR